MNEELITGFLNIAECDRKTAQVFLQGNNYDLAKAVAEYYENPDPQRFEDMLNWNEEDFSTGRNGPQSQMDALPPYQMDDDERQSRSLVPLGAPSRPPSRNKSRMSLRSSKDMEMVPYGPFQQGEDNDSDMEKALRLSMEDQQTGIIDASGNEYVPDPEVMERQRRPGEPAFLKPLPGNNFLPSLITTLHSIPQCRELLLSRLDVHIDYGNNKHWWEGETIETARVVAIGQDVDLFEQQDVIHEVQRLMAFLSRTDRSYGSAAALSRLKALQSIRPNSMNEEDPLARFMMTWEYAAGNSKSNHEFNHIFKSIIQGDIHRDPINVYLLDVKLGDLPAAPHSSLYDILDQCFWRASSSKPPTPDSFLSQVGPIVVVRLPSRSTSTGNRTVTIPVTLYADRYLDSSESLVKEMHASMDGDRTAVDSLDNRLGKLEVFHESDKGRTGSASKMLDSAISYIQEHGQTNGDELMNDITHQEILEQDEQTYTMNGSQVLARLQAINGQLQVRVNSLREEKEKAEASLKKFSKLLTDPNEVDGSIPNRAYRLRGVGIATSNQSHTTYVMHPSSIATSTDDENPSEVWWRMSYDTAGNKALVSKEEVVEKVVVDAAGELLSDTLLVYACDEMLDPADEESLPSALQEFVAIDNASFREELEIASSSPPIIEGRPVEIDGTQDASIPEVKIDNTYLTSQSIIKWQREQSHPLEAEQQTRLGDIDPSMTSLSALHDRDDMEADETGPQREMEEIGIGETLRLRDRVKSTVEMEGLEADSDTATLGSDGGGDGSDVEMGGLLMRGGNRYG